MKTKILLIFGTRPEAIKMAPVYSELLKDDNFETKICVTGQHRQMLDQVLHLFKIEPEYDLNLMRSGQTLSEITSKTLSGLSTILETFSPDVVLVQGDTTTALSGTLASFYHHIPVGHIEAGLRTGDINAPWPEELNRSIISKMTKWHFCPTNNSKNNLINEGYRNNIYVTGNTVIDALFSVVEKISTEKTLIKELSEQFSFLSSTTRLILVTGHRRENFGDGMKQICEGILGIAEREDVQVVYPVHLNPNVQKPVFSLIGNHPRIKLLPPLDYVPFVYLMTKAHIILTDSGGVQEEAPSLGVPVLVMRDKTERPEAIEAGTVRLVGTNPNLIIKECNLLLDDNGQRDLMRKSHNPYGDGTAAQQIVRILTEEIKK